MRIKTKYRAAAFMLSIAVLSTALCGCSSTDTTVYNADSYFEDVRTDASLIYNSRGEFTINVLSDNADFSENISAKDITICYPKVNGSLLPEIDSENGIQLTDEEYNVETLSPANITRNSARSLTVDFSDPQFDAYRPMNYTLILSPKTNSAKKYLFASPTVRYPSYSLVCDVSQISENDSPVKLRLTVDSTTFSEDISAEDITLSGSFDGSVITDFELTGDNTVSLTIDKVNSDYIKNGKITVASSAVTNAVQDIFTFVRVISPKVFFLDESLEISRQEAYFTINLQDCQFAENLTADMLTTENERISVRNFKRVSQSQAQVTLIMPSGDITEISELLTSAEFTLAPQAISLTQPLDFSLEFDDTNISVRINNVAKTDNRITARLDFSILSGSFNNVSRSSFIFSGDFAGASVDSVTSQNNTLSVSIAIDREGAGELSELTGAVVIRSGGITDIWGEDENALSVPLYYNFSDPSDNTADFKGKYGEVSSIAARLNDKASYLSDVSDVSALISAEENGFTDYQTLVSNNRFIQPLLYQSMQCISSEHLSRTGEQIYADRDELIDFICDIQSLWAASRSTCGCITQLAELDELIASTTDDEERDTYTAKYNELIGSISRLCGSTIRGEKFSQKLIELINRYISGKGMLKRFDSIADCIYNWRSQSENVKNDFRYAINSIITQAVCAQLISLRFASDSITGEKELSDLISCAKRLSDYMQGDALSDTGKSLPFCTTLGRTLRLTEFSSAVLGSEISYDEISQLINMLPTDMTLREELELSGFDISQVRYIVCSDAPINTIVSSLSSVSGSDIIKKFSVVGRASVFDLVKNEFVNDFEYNNSEFSVTLDPKSGIIEYSQTVYTSLRLYSLG